LIYLSDTKRFLGEKTFFVWPEGVLPSTNVNDIMFYKELFEQNFDDNHYIAIGLNREETINGRKFFYNSLALLDSNANLITYYDKKKLVPFGEFLPLENILSKLGLKSLTNNYQSYSKGKNEKSINVKDIDLNFLATICYEIIYSGELNSKSDYNFIINVSEDGWFGKSIGPHQHFTHSIFRAIENGRTVIRSANNGISAIIEPNGTIKSRIDLVETGSIFTNEIYFRDTIFSNYGNKTFFLLILIYIFLIFSFNKTKNE
jgi:apolipoprotein N-acyltransferase